MGGDARGVRAILWDNDGVLVDTERLYFEATRDILATVGVELTQEMFVDLLLVQSRGAWHLAEAKGVSPAQVERLREARNDRYGHLLESEPLVMDGVKDTLERLYGRFIMGVVTSSRRDHFDIIHRRSGLLKYFSFAVTNEDYTHPKPDPEPYLVGIERTRVAPSECVVVEDSQRGLTAAVRAGLRCYVAPHDITRGQAFDGAYKILHHVSEVADDLLEV